MNVSGPINSNVVTQSNREQSINRDSVRKDLGVAGLSAVIPETQARVEVSYIPPVSKSAIIENQAEKYQQLTQQKVVNQQPNELTYSSKGERVNDQIQNYGSISVFV